MAWPNHQGQPGARGSQPPGKVAQPQVGRGLPSQAPSHPTETRPGGCLGHLEKNQENQQSRRGSQSEQRGRGCRENLIPWEAGRPPNDPPLRTNTCHSAVVFQESAFLKGLENILEELNKAFVEAVPYTCLCSFNKDSRRACLVLDA